MIRDMAADDALPDQPRAGGRRLILSGPAVGWTPAPGTPGSGRTRMRVRASRAGYDPYLARKQMAAFWHGSGRPALRSPDAAFVAFAARAARAPLDAEACVPRAEHSMGCGAHVASRFID